MFNIHIKNKPRDNTAEIKQAIVKGRDRGMCDRDGRTINYHPNQAGKGDRDRTRNKKLFDRRCPFKSKLNIWPRDEKGKLIGNEKDELHTGECYQYLYGGPGPDYISLVVIGDKNGKLSCLDIDTNKALNFDFPNKALTRMGPENWRSAIRCQKDKRIKKLMKLAYQKVFL